jgi:hypothetical protein
MQIFFLSMNPQTIAKHLCDKHVLSECKELFQILCTIWAVYSPEKYQKYHNEGKLIGKWTHPGHPSIKWASASIDNYLWTCELLMECLMEFKFRRGKEHTYHKLMDDFLEMGAPNLPDLGFIPMSKVYQAIADQGIKDDDPVISYRRYYIMDKSRFAQWNWGREMPEWYSKRNEYHGYKWTTITTGSKMSGEIS